jgi:protein tyrosine/serine phosphatase
VKHRISIVFAIALACTGCSSVSTGPVPNLRVVSSGVFRSGQPTVKDWTGLHDVLGITRDLKLNSGVDWGAAQADVCVVYDPISFWRQMIGPTDEQIQTAVLAIRNDGTLIHCTHGQDRTGLIVGIYRREIQGWSKEAAYAEMKANGFHWELVGLWWYWHFKVK